MKVYLVMDGENFQDAVAAHFNDAYKSIEDARSAAMLLLAPGDRYYLCDEQGGVFVIGKVPFMVGET